MNYKTFLFTIHFTFLSLAASASEIIINNPVAPEKPNGILYYYSMEVRAVNQRCPNNNQPGKLFHISCGDRNCAREFILDVNDNAFTVPTLTSGTEFCIYLGQGSYFGGFGPFLMGKSESCHIELTFDKDNTIQNLIVTDVPDNDCLSMRSGV